MKLGSVPHFVLALLLGLTVAQARAQAADYQIGQRLNAAKRYAEAAESLELAMLRDPDDRRIQLEYAIALAGSGDVASAQQLLLQLRSDPALDAATRRQIDALIKQTWLQAHLPAVPDVSVSLMVGHDDNLLGAPRQGAFDLTLPWGNLTVSPADDAKPRAGFFTRADLRLNGALPSASQHAQPLRYGLFLGLSKTADQIADRNNWGLLLEKQHLLLHGSYLQAAHQQLSVQASPVYRQTLLGAGMTLAGAAWGLICHARLGAELQRRHYPQADLLDGQYTGVQMHATCPASALQVTLRFGQDRPRQTDRPGGMQQHSAVKLAYQARFYQGDLRAEAEWSLQRDRTGYSPLLENNRRRVLQRGVYRAEYLWGSGGGSQVGWRPFVGIEWLHQQANLPLFSLRNRVISVGVMTAW
jgi:hypothetical protein